MSISHILIIEDDAEMSATLREGFELDLYQVTVAHDGGRGLHLAQQNSFQAIVLDVMLPVFDGFTVATKLRAGGDKTPILMLTARDSVSDIVHAFDVGAEDYLTKPFSFLELSARVRSLIRRSSPPATILTIGDLTFDTASLEVHRQGIALTLTKSELLLLEVLMRNPGKVVRRAELAAAVWGPSLNAVDQNNLDVTMSSLRSRIDKGFPQRLIRTVRGFGYSLDAGGWS